MTAVSVDDVRAARDLLGGVAVPTPWSRPGCCRSSSAGPSC
ncbi:hypothetical protein [Actinomadura madurae]|nr:hypothetical protein [Actinomadura madurae]